MSHASLTERDKASTGQYTEAELPGSFGPATGTPEQGIDDTLILYADPRTESKHSGPLAPVVFG